MRYFLLGLCGLFVVSLAGCVTFEDRPVYGATSSISDYDLHAAVRAIRLEHPDEKLWALRVVDPNEVRFYYTREEDDHFWRAERVKGRWQYTGGPIITADPLGYHLPNEA
jgi:hypothetical protein